MQLSTEPLPTLSWSLVDLRSSFSDRAGQPDNDNNHDNQIYHKFFRKGETKAVSGHYLLKSGVDFLEGGIDCASGLAERGIQSGPTIER